MRGIVTNFEPTDGRMNLCGCSDGQPADCFRCEADICIATSLEPGTNDIETVILCQMPYLINETLSLMHTDKRYPAQAGSLTYDHMIQHRLCVSQADGTMRNWGGWTLPTCSVNSSTDRLFKPANCLYDPSNPRARDFLWQKLKESYFEAGITCGYQFIYQLSSCITFM
jgi:hypothetical protein